MTLDNLLWLGPVFDEATMLASPAVSPAANRWQLGLIRALQQAGVVVEIATHLPEPAWPRRRLYVRAANGRLPVDLRGALTGYWNLPIGRQRSIGAGYRQLIRCSSSANTQAVVITYNAYPANVSGARYARETYGIPWICIVADDVAPPDADGYVFLSWGYYEEFATMQPKLHLDGGIIESRFSAAGSFAPHQHDRQVVMFSGSMSRFTGVEFLARAFCSLQIPTAELWICGKGSNSEVEQLAKSDPRIKIWGLVSDDRLVELAQQADIFVNPRPSILDENKRNFPSKVLEYLSYGKPVISTYTFGLSPDYRDVLVIIEEETIQCLIETINSVLNWNSRIRQANFESTRKFLQSRLWSVQADRLLSWLRDVRD